MGKVVKLFESADVQSLLCDAADQGFAEVMVIGKLPDGCYFLKKTAFNSSVETVGILEMAKQWLLEQM